jgi:hypothetical protein
VAFISFNKKLFGETVKDLGKAITLELCLKKDLYKLSRLERISVNIAVL